MLTTNVWGTLNMPLKIFGQGRWKGIEFAEEKRSVTSNEIFFGTLTSFISRKNQGHSPVLPTRYSRQNIVSICAKFLKSDDRILRDRPPKSTQNEKNSYFRHISTSGGAATALPRPYFAYKCLVMPRGGRLLPRGRSLSRS